MANKERTRQLIRCHFALQISGVYPICKECIFDPTTSWVYQREYPRKLLPKTPNDNPDEEGDEEGDEEEEIYIGPQQMAYLSYPPTKDKYFESQYIFDDSAGSGIPVYVVDTGAHLDHKVCPRRE